MLAGRQKRLARRAGNIFRGRYVKGNWVLGESPEGHAVSWSPEDTEDGDDVLDSLRDFLDRNKLLGPNDLVPDCKVCAEGAIYTACALDPEATDADASAVLAEATKPFLDSYGSIPAINDAEKKTEKEVWDAVFAPFESP